MQICVSLPFTFRTALEALAPICKSIAKSFAHAEDELRKKITLTKVAAKEGMERCIVLSQGRMYSTYYAYK